MDELNERYPQATEDKTDFFASDISAYDKMGADYV